MEGYLEANESTIFFAVAVAVFLLAVSWESIWPRRPVSKDSVNRWGHNLGLGLLNQVVIYWLDVVITVAIIWWVAKQGYGLLARFEVGFVVSLIVTVLSFELLAYVLHRLLHRVPWLWRLHAVHHSDTELDFSTTYRNHPLELLIVSGATVPLLILLGPPVTVVLLYQIARLSVNIMAHSNVYLPRSIESWLRYIIVTPDFHRCHHSDDQRFTDSNYGAFLPWFDYLFGSATSKPFEEHPKMTIGLTYFREPKDSYFIQLLIMPFKRFISGN